MAFINLTPHMLNIHCTDGPVQDIPPSGVVARCKVTNTHTGSIDGIDIYTSTYGEVMDLPPESDDLLIVSFMVASHPSVRGRSDVFSPGELVRDAEGKPIGCLGLKSAR